LSPLSGQICTKTDNADYENCAAYNLVFVALWHIREGLNIYSPAITAVATAVIGAFTITLWNASEKQARLTREAMVHGERAFIAAINLRGFFEPVGREWHWRFRPTWVNSGDTPTRNMLIHTECLILNAVLPLNFNFNYPTTNTGTGFLGAKANSMGGLAPMAPRPAVSPRDILDAQQGRTFIHVFGWAKYNDIFPNTPRHITRFCWIVVPDGDPTTFDPAVNPNNVRFDWIMHTVGNCADEECDA
jgi:hypothetical protein